MSIISFAPGTYPISPPYSDSSDNSDDWAAVASSFYKGQLAHLTGNFEALRRFQLTMAESGEQQQQQGSAASTNENNNNNQVKNYPPRRLITWTDEKNAHLLILIDHVCKEKGIKIPWDEIAPLLNEGTTSGAIEQHISKIRSKRMNQGLPTHPATKHRRKPPPPGTLKVEAPPPLPPRVRQRRAARRSVGPVFNKGFDPDEGDPDDDFKPTGPSRSAKKGPGKGRGGRRKRSTTTPPTPPSTDETEVEEPSNDARLTAAFPNYNAPAGQMSQAQGPVVKYEQASAQTYNNASVNGPVNGPVNGTVNGSTLTLAPNNTQSSVFTPYTAPAVTGFDHSQLSGWSEPGPAVPTNSMPTFGQSFNTMATTGPSPAFDMDMPMAAGFGGNDDYAAYMMPNFGFNNNYMPSSTHYDFATEPLSAHSTNSSFSSMNSLGNQYAAEPTMGAAVPNAMQPTIGFGESMDQDAYENNVAFPQMEVEGMGDGDEEMGGQGWMGFEGH